MPVIPAGSCHRRIALPIDEHAVGGSVLTNLEDIECAVVAVAVLALMSGRVLLSSVGAGSVCVSNTECGLVLCLMSSSAPQNARCVAREHGLALDR